MTVFALSSVVKSGKILWTHLDCRNKHRIKYKDEWCCAGKCQYVCIRILLHYCKSNDTVLNKMCKTWMRHTGVLVSQTLQDSFPLTLDRQYASCLIKNWVTFTRKMCIMLLVCFTKLTYKTNMTQSGLCNSTFFITCPRCAHTPQIPYSIRIIFHTYFANCSKVGCFCTT